MDLRVFLAIPKSEHEEKESLNRNKRRKKIGIASNLLKGNKSKYIVRVETSYKATIIVKKRYAWMLKYWKSYNTFEVMSRV